MSEDASPAARKRSLLRSDLRDAMRARDTRRVSVLRGLMAAIDNFEAVALQADTPRDGPRTRAISEHVAVTGYGPSEVARRELTEAEVRDVVAGEVASMQSAAAELRTHGAQADAEELDAKTEIARVYV